MNKKVEISLEHYENASEMIGMYAFYDTKSNRYDTPFFCQNDLFAGRHYKMVVDRHDTMINTFKRDFEVHRLGFFDVFMGNFVDFHEIIIDGKKLYKEDEE